MTIRHATGPHREARPSQIKPSYEQVLFDSSSEHQLRREVGTSFMHGNHQDRIPSVKVPPSRAPGREEGGRVVHSRMHAPSTAALNGLFIAFISNPFWAPRTRTKQITDTRLRKNERVMCSQKHAKFS